MNPIFQRLIISMGLILFISMDVHAYANVRGFVKNCGQVLNQSGEPNNEVLFVLPCNGYNVLITKHGYSYEVFQYTINQSASGPLISEDNAVFDFKQVSAKFHRVDADFSQPFNQDQVITQNTLPVYFNFYNQFGKLHEVPVYQKVTIKNLYSGIDLEFEASGNDSKPFEYNFIVQPNASVSQINITYNGQHQLNLKNKAIQLSTDFGYLEETIPASFYASTREPLSAEYVRSSHNEVRFEIGQFDKSSTIVIDPVVEIEWATYYGSTSLEYARDMSHDDQNNYYLTGSTLSALNFATSGAYQTDFAGGALSGDGFVAKFSSAGDLLWCTYIGGEGDDELSSIDVLDDALFILGASDSEQGISTADSHQEAIAGEWDAVLLSFDLNGNRLWGTYFGGEGYDLSFDVVAASSDKIIVTGSTPSLTGIATTGSHQETLNGPSDFYIARFNNTGELNWSSYFGGSGYDGGPLGAGLDATNDFIAFAGRTSSSDAIATTGAYQQTINGSSDSMVSSWSLDGTLIWSTYFGGSSSFDLVKALCIDESQNIIIIGETESASGIATVDAHQTVIGNTRDCFLSKFTSSGNISWSTYYGGEAYDYAFDVITDPSDKIYVLASTQSTSAMSTSDAFQLEYIDDPSPGPSSEAVIARFTQNGALDYGTYFGGEPEAILVALDIDNELNVFSFGHTYGDGLATDNAYQGEIAGIQDLFLVKFNGLTNSIASISLDDPSIMISPNPASLYVSVQSFYPLTGNIIISDITGKLISTTSIQNINSVTIDVSNLASSPIIVSVVTENQMLSRKVVLLQH